MKEGKLREVKNDSSRVEKRYAANGVPGEGVTPSLADSIAMVLRTANSPLRPVEIGVALLEEGHKVKDDATAAVGEILRVLRDRPDVFVETEGYWKHRKRK